MEVGIGIEYESFLLHKSGRWQAVRSAGFGSSNGCGVDSHAVGVRANHRGYNEKRRNIAFLLFFGGPDETQLSVITHIVQLFVFV